MKISFKIKLIIFISLIAVLPILIFSFYSIQRSNNTSVVSVKQGNRNTAKQIAGRIDQYLKNSELIFRTLAENLTQNNLSVEQKKNSLQNFALNFDEFHFFHLINSKNELEVSSQLNPNFDFNKLAEIRDKISREEFYHSEVYLTEDFVPAMLLVIPIAYHKPSSSLLVGQVDLLKLWQFIKDLKIGERGHASILTSQGKIFATGAGFLKKEAIQMAIYPGWNLLQKQKEHPFEYSSSAEKFLVVSDRVMEPYSWIVTVEQPVDEAYALSYLMKKDLTVILGLILMSSIVLGWISGKKFIVTPINKLMGRIEEISQGHLEGTVDIKGHGELAKLGQTLNSMSADLIKNQELLVEKERQALLGRLASGLAHDLKHPIISIENHTKLLERRYDDVDYREKFRKTTEREFKRIHRFLENLRDLSKPIQFSPQKINSSSLIEDTLSPMMPELYEAKIEVRKNLRNDLSLNIDIFSFQRAFNNIVRNAKEAMPEGGCLSIETGKVESDSLAYIKISDTGSGIPKDELPKIFESFKTTKRGGLGLGLAITNKIIKRHGGSVQIESKVGQGTTFILNFPLS